MVQEYRINYFIIFAQITVKGYTAQKSCTVELDVTLTIVLVLVWRYKHKLRVHICFKLQFNFQQVIDKKGKLDFQY